MKIKILILTAILIFNGCRDQSELSMERGEYYYSVDRFEDAVLEYTRVINSYPDDLSSFNSHTIEMIANAHHNLSVIMFKRGYKSDVVTAPMNEVLAAGLILLSDWNRISDF